MCRGYSRPPTLVGYQAAEFSCERRFLSALPPCCFRKYLATELTNLKGVVGDLWERGVPWQNSSIIITPIMQLVLAILIVTVDPYRGTTRLGIAGMI